MTEDAEIIAKVIAGDIDAFRVLVERYQRPVFAMMRAMTANEADREDTAQEVFLTAYTKLRTFDARRATFVTWLLTITRNHCLNRLKRRTDATSEHLPEQPDMRTPPDIVTEQETFALFDAALAGLPLDQRTAFTLAEIHGLSHAEIAAIEQIEIGTVKSRIGRAREKIRLVFQGA